MGIEILNNSADIRIRTTMYNVGIWGGNPILFSSDGGYNDIEFIAHYSSTCAQPLAAGTMSANSRLVARAGRNSTATSINTDTRATKTSGSGVAPSATANTYGTPSTIATPSNLQPDLPITYLQITSGGTFGSETVTARVKATYQDGTTGTATTTFPSSGATYNMQSTSAVYNLQANGKQIVKLALDCELTITNSTATIGWFYLGQR